MLNTLHDVRGVVSYVLGGTDRDWTHDTCECEGHNCVECLAWRVAEAFAQPDYEWRSLLHVPGHPVMDELDRLAGHEENEVTASEASPDGAE